METVTFQGFEFPRHPPRSNVRRADAARFRAAVNALSFARSQLTPPERAVWLALCKVEAMLMGMEARAREAVSLEASEPIWLNAGDGLSNSRPVPRSGSG